MNNESCCQKTRASIYALAVLATLFLLAGLVSLMRHYTKVEPITQARVTERVKNLKDLQAATAPLLENYDWQDKAKDIIRVPIDQAKEIVLQEWQNPAAARSNLMARAAKAFAVAPPPPNPYE